MKNLMLMLVKTKKKKSKKLFGMKNINRVSRYWKVILWSIVLILLFTEIGREMMGIY